MIQNPPGTSGGVLLNAPAPKLDGGQEHVARLITTDGTGHLVAFNFNAPVQDGVIDLKAAEAVKHQAREQGLANIVQTIARAQMAPLAAAVGQQVKVSPVLEGEGGVLVVLTHVVSVEYLGRLVERDPGMKMLTVELGGVTSRYAYRAFAFGEFMPPVAD